MDDERELPSAHQPDLGSAVLNPDVIQALQTLQTALSSGIPAAGKNMIIGRNEGAINATFNVNVQQETAQPTPAKIDTDYYNLFVSFGETYEGKHFDMMRSRAVTEHGFTTDEIIKECEGLTKQVRARLMRYPCLFAAETVYEGGSVDPEQKAYYGFITKINMLPDTVRIYFTKLREIYQSDLDEHLAELGLTGRHGYNELTHTHWAVKNIDIGEGLRELGYDIPAAGTDDRQ